MTALVWDQPGEHVFEAGVDRGVFYGTDRLGIPWNGLTSVVEITSGRTVTPIYYDGVRISDSQVVGEFAGTLSALTYPEVFEEYDGSVEFHDGVHIRNQYLKYFQMSYRTRIGTDTDGIDAGYKLHVLFNLLAIPRDQNFATLNDAPEAMVFSWGLSSSPEKLDGYLPVSHLVIDSTKVTDDFLRDMETILYGDDESVAYLPPFAEFMEFINSWVGLKIIDNGDGTWTAIGTENYITMTGPTEFQLTDVVATYLDPETYTISSGSAD